GGFWRGARGPSPALWGGGGGGGWFCNAFPASLWNAILPPLAVFFTSFEGYVKPIVSQRDEAGFFCGVQNPPRLFTEEQVLVGHRIVEIGVGGQGVLDTFETLVDDLLLFVRRKTVVFFYSTMPIQTANVLFGYRA